jgi:hypothetical protein
MKRGVLLCLSLWLLSFLSFGQSDSSGVRQFSSKVPEKLGAAADRQEQQVTSATTHLLKGMMQEEDALDKNLAAADPGKAERLFGGSKERYLGWMQKLQVTPGVGNGVSSRQYIPSMDSLLTGLSFIRQHPEMFSSGASLDKATNQVQQLQERFFQAGNIQQFVKGRADLLKSQLGGSAAGKRLLRMNKNMFYFQQQLATYKALWSDKQKMVQTIVGAVRQVPAFQGYFQRYSYISQLFPPPPGLGTPQALAGLQSRTDVQEAVKRVATQAGAGADPGAYLQQQAQAGQQTLDQLKSKAGQLGLNSASGDLVMPDFAPNSNHNKTFFKRLQAGFNMQNSGSSGLLPVTSALAATLGYKLTDKVIVGIGAGYLLGLGNGLSSIHLSSQGLTLRSFLDVKAKGSIWLTGGFEYSWYQAFSLLKDIPHLDVWQKSALIGVSKKYSIGKRGGSLQLLYDLLYQHEVPQGQPFRFRIGFNF